MLYECYVLMNVVLNYRSKKAMWSTKYVVAFICIVIVDFL